MATRRTRRFLRVYLDNPEPVIGDDGVPRCHDACPHHDGKRCELLGVRAYESNPCEPEVAEMAAELRALATERVPRPLDEWHEDDGDVLWWTFPVREPPYVGSPLDDDWPGAELCTHWTPIPIPAVHAPRLEDAALRFSSRHEVDDGK